MRRDASILTSWLEVELQGKLDFARLTCSRRFSKVRVRVTRIGTLQAVCLCVQRYGIGCKVRVNTQELSVVQSIEELCSELN